MAGKKRRANKVRQQKYVANKAKVPINKKKRQERHKKHQEKLAILKAERIQMIPQALKVLRVQKIGELKKQIGTLSTKRLSDVVNGVYLDAEWYKKRHEPKEETKIITSNKKKSKSRKGIRKKIQRIHESGTRRDKEIHREEKQG